MDCKLVVVAIVENLDNAASTAVSEAAEAAEAVEVPSAVRMSALYSADMDGTAYLWRWSRCRNEILDRWRSSWNGVMRRCRSISVWL